MNTGLREERLPVSGCSLRAGTCRSPRLKAEAPGFSGSQRGRGASTGGEFVPRCARSVARACTSASEQKPRPVRLRHSSPRSAAWPSMTARRRRLGRHHAPRGGQVGLGADDPAVDHASQPSVGRRVRTFEVWPFDDGQQPAVPDDQDGVDVIVAEDLVHVADSDGTRTDLGCVDHRLSHGTTAIRQPFRVHRGCTGSRQVACSCCGAPAGGPARYKRQVRTLLHDNSRSLDAIVVGLICVIRAPGALVVCSPIVLRAGISPRPWSPLASSIPALSVNSSPIRAGAPGCRVGGRGCGRRCTGGSRSRSVRRRRVPVG